MKIKQTRQVRLDELIEWIKVGDVIEVDGKKAKLKSIVEDLTYTNLYTFKREDGSKFHWRHENIYKYVMERHIEKLESLLCEKKRRADRAEKRWSALREYLNDGENLYLVELTRDEVIRKMHDLEEESK